jgi:DNA-binding transcriptional MerR regulator
MKKKEEENIYPIRVVAKLTGLSQDAIRAWEKRYGAVVPARSRGNTRKYSGEDIRRLSLLKEATAQGHSIKNVARLSEDRLRKLIEHNRPIRGSKSVDEPFPDSQETYDGLRAEYMIAIHRFDVRRAQRLLSRAAALLTPNDLIFHLLIPLLRNTGHLWLDEKISVSHEHLISMQVRALLVKMLDFHATQAGAPKIIVATPENHHHEFGALIGAFIAVNRGFDPIYLGPNMPEKDLAVAVDISRADLLLLSVLKDMTEKEQAELNGTLTRLAQKIDTWMGLPEKHSANGIVPAVTYINTFEELDAALTRRIS